jgi:hypothetical protein
MELRLQTTSRARLATKKDRTVPVGESRVRHRLMTEIDHRHERQESNVLTEDATLIPEAESTNDKYCFPENTTAPAARPLPRGGAIRSLSETGSWPQRYGYSIASVRGFDGSCFGIRGRWTREEAGRPPVRGPSWAARADLDPIGATPTRQPTAVIAFLTRWTGVFLTSYPSRGRRG